MRLRKWLPVVVLGASGLCSSTRLLGALSNWDNSANWKQATNSSARYQLLPQPALAPPGATGALVSFRLTTNAANDLPTVFVDDVELVDVTAGP